MHDFVYSSSYTRAQAITDGVLVDVGQLARECGFKVPVALTSAVWGDCVEWSEADESGGAVQDEAGRLWDVLWMASLAGRRGRNQDRVSFRVLRVPRGGMAPAYADLVLHIGPGDQGEPVITIMQPGED